MTTERFITSPTNQLRENVTRHIDKNLSPVDQDTEHAELTFSWLSTILTDAAEGSEELTIKERRALASEALSEDYLDASCIQLAIAKEHGRLLLSAAMRDTYR